MKKILFGAVLLAAYGTTIAQTPEDALRYSWLQGSGTARSQAIGNANGAIGGEISTIFSNPANIGFYKTGDFVISGGVNINNNTSTYYGNNTKAPSSSNAFLGTTGVVLGRPNYSGGSVKGGAFGIAVNKTADFNNSIHYETGGTLVRSSMANMFIEAANGNAYNQLNPYGSGLAFDSYWIDTAAGGRTYTSSAAALAGSTGLGQKQEIFTSGGISEVALAGALNINEKVFFGGTIGLPILEYRAKREYTEQDPNATNTTNEFDVAYFDDNLITRGMGVNVKAGVVVKATENFRLGFAAHSPTFYSLSDNYSAAAGTALENYPTHDGENAYDVVSQRDLIYDYSLHTPYKLIGSFSYFFGDVHNVASQKGFLSGDVEYVNHMASNFKNASDDSQDNRSYFSELNRSIDNAYKGVVNARLGAELKFNTIMARFGGAYYGNPYRDLAGETGNIVQGSTGLGYRNKGFFIDLGYTHTFGNDVVFPYRLQNNPLNPATIKSSNSRILLTLGFKI